MSDETFKLVSPMLPTGDQPQAIAQLVQGCKPGISSRRCWRYRQRQDVYNGKRHCQCKLPHPGAGP